jgi:hypothetical protein
LNLRPLGYEPNELPDCSTPHLYITMSLSLSTQTVPKPCSVAESEPKRSHRDRGTQIGYTTPQSTVPIARAGIPVRSLLCTKKIRTRPVIETSVISIAEISITITHAVPLSPPFVQIVDHRHEP